MRPGKTLFLEGEEEKEEEVEEVQKDIGIPFKILFKSLDFLSNHWGSFHSVLNFLPKSMDFLLISSRNPSS